MKICLVSCGKAKKAFSTPAKDLYTSSRFLKSRYIAEKYFDSWFILSAKHGLLLPEKIISPYNITLNSFSVTQNKKWSKEVFIALQKKLEAKTNITILAGKNYYHYLVPLLVQNDFNINLPLKGKGMGKSLQILNQIILTEGKEWKVKDDK